MKKFMIAVCSIVLAIGVTGCVGKAPVGKGKAPVVQTRGWWPLSHSLAKGSKWRQAVSTRLAATFMRDARADRYRRT